MRKEQQEPAGPLPREAGLVARGSVVNIAAMTLGTVLGFALTVLASRWLQPRGAGVFFEVIALFTIASNTLQLGADTGLTRWIAQARAIGGIADIRRIVMIAATPILIVGAVAVIGMWVSAPELARIFLHGISTKAAANDIRLVAVLVPLGALSACLLAAARGFGRMWPYLGVEGLGKPILRIGLVLGALIAGLGLRGALIGWSLPIAVGFAVSLLVLTRLIRAAVPAGRQEPSPRSRNHLGAEFWRFSAPRGLAGIFQVVVVWLDILLVGALLSSYQAGIYAAVSKLVMVGTFALEGTRLAIAPQLSGLLARREFSRAAGLYQTATHWLMLASWPVYVVFAIFPAVALQIFGHRYAAGSSALVVLCLAMLVNLGTGNVTVVLLMGGKSSWNVLNTLAALVVNVGLNLVLLPRIGIVGAAIAWAVSIAVDNLAALVEVWWILGLAPFNGGYAVVVAASAGCFGATGLAARALLGQTLPALVAATVLGLIGCAAICYAARGRLQLVGLFAALRRRRPAHRRTGSGRHRAQAEALGRPERRST
jgi:O-antigen/teichoic acid export membrane protein